MSMLFLVRAECDTGLYTYGVFRSRSLATKAQEILGLCDEVCSDIRIQAVESGAVDGTLKPEGNLSFVDVEGYNPVYEIDVLYQEAIINNCGEQRALEGVFIKRHSSPNSVCFSLDRYGVFDFECLAKARRVLEILGYPVGYSVASTPESEVKMVGLASRFGQNFDSNVLYLTNDCDTIDYKGTRFCITVHLKE